jgi:hypothetical protein
MGELLIVQIYILQILRMICNMYICTISNKPLSSARLSDIEECQVPFPINE